MNLKICTYTDVVKFYQDYFKYRKSKDSKFSYEIWSSELGFKSRTFMKLIASGKRKTTDKLIEVFSVKNEFNENEKKHLIHLSLYQRAKTELQKKMHFESVLQTLDSSSQFTIMKNYADFLSSPNLLRLQLILSFKELSHTEGNIARMTGQTLKQVRIDLKKLEKFGMAYSENGIWKSNYLSVQIPDEYQSEALKKYHNFNLEEAQDVISKDDLKRRYRSIMFALSDDQFSHLTEEVEAFLTKIKNKYINLKSKNERIYKINLQAYPVTKTLV